MDDPETIASISLETGRRRACAGGTRPGVTPRNDGAIFRVNAPRAGSVHLSLFGTDASPAAETRHRMRRVAGGFWEVFVPGAGPGTRYGYRVDGPWEPGQGHRHNPAKLLLDPYAQAVSGSVTWRPEVFGHTVDDAFHGDPTVRDARDSAAFVPRSVVVDHAFDWRDDDERRPRVAMADAVIYEMHVKGFTRCLPDVPAELRGTYAGLAHPAATSHLRELGITSVELLPVHAFADEPHLVKLGLTNYWGYNTLGFCAPHAGYAAADSAQGVVDEFKTMVRALHEAGLEVILDVVYNHTAEQGGHEGATLSWRGLDNAGAYRLDEFGRDADVTGCGNTLDLRDPSVLRLVLDSLRLWVSEYHVDGFRFDLAVALGRSPGDDFDPRAALLMAMQADPVLADVKLIAEPWDVGPDGWRTGQFGYPFAEWNDRFRNTVRDFWLGDLAAITSGTGVGAGVADLATRLAGSQDLFGGPGRGPSASVNYVTAHDGFTLADLTAYAHKHNEANGEDNRDGTDDNRSWNHGAEGWPSTSGDVDLVRMRARRLRSMRNVLGTLLLSSGVPMLTAGDEFARSQGGNNNAYCQDSPVSWVDWDLHHDQRDLLATTRYLLALRHRFSVLRHERFYSDASTSPHEAFGAVLTWFGLDGASMRDDAWHDAATRTLQAYFGGGNAHEENAVEESVLLVLHSDLGDADLVLPSPPGVEGWQVLWDSADAVPAGGREHIRAGAVRHLDGPTMLVLAPATNESNPAN